VADTPSFDEFFLATSGRLLGQLTAMTADRAQAEDVLQEAYAKAWLRWGRVSGLDSPEAWVRTVAWRHAVSRWRRMRVALTAQSRLAQLDSVDDPDVTTSMVVRAALARLPAAQRRALVLYEVCDLSVEQVARETGVSTGTVKSRLSRGRAALAELLPRNDEEEVPHGSGA
jgi:RNA polymerase sigma-70 factor (ECF subfamily)